MQRLASKQGSILGSYLPILAIALSIVISLLFSLVTLLLRDKVDYLTDRHSERKVKAASN